MPSIEVVCIGQTEPLELGPLSFAVVSGTRLVSHRTPTPLFQSDFDQLEGCMYHLGNPELRSKARTGTFFAYELLSESSRHGEPFLEFADEHRPDVGIVLSALLAASPEGRLLFTSDWQFGPEGAKRHPAVTLAEFWRLHDARTLRLNAAYAIVLAA
jgi:hypothetical protein